MRRNSSREMISVPCGSDEMGRRNIIKDELVRVCDCML